MTKPWARSDTSWAEPPGHPAKFSKELLPVIADALKGYYRVLDPMAGVGTLAKYLYSRTPYPEPAEHEVWSNELELEWAQQCPTPCSAMDARNMLRFRDGEFDAVATSPAYGNRMADRYAGDAKGSRRHTYRTSLGRELTLGNGAALQWGDAYRELHEAIWRECVRVLRPGGRMVVNVKDHIRDGQRQYVSSWHFATLMWLGLTCISQEEVPCPGQRHGANGDLRVDNEYVLVFDKS